jgi:hypothetical protein
MGTSSSKPGVGGGEAPSTARSVPSSIGGTDVSSRDSMSNSAMLASKADANRKASVTPANSGEVKGKDPSKKSRITMQEIEKMKTMRGGGGG